MSDELYPEEYLVTARNLGRELALERLESGALDDWDCTGEPDDDGTIADTESVVLRVTGKKLHELDEIVIIEIVEAHDESYIDTYMEGL